MRTTYIPLLLAGILCSAGCAGEQWTPPPPAGVTYQYDYQGFRERNTTVVVSTVGGQQTGAAFAGVFSFQDDFELRGRSVADPFAESSLIDGIHFNSHIGAAGIPVDPAPAASSAPATTPVPPSSAWPVAPAASSAPMPGGFL